MEILNGKDLSLKIKKELSEETEILFKKYGRRPGLAIILVGDNSASKIYVNSKIKGCKEIGIESFSCFLEEKTTEEELLKIIDELNNNKNIDGILVQLPLPKHINEKNVIEKISLKKDVDGFKPENLGLLLLNDPSCFVSCTPAGIMRLIKEYKIDMIGKDVVIIGRSNIVGKPLAGLMINSGATVTVCNSKTKNLSEKTQNADIIVVAAGVQNLLKKEMVKEGVIVIDVGINRTSEGIVGDVDFKNVSKKCSYITPVPGGVGPMTVAMLFANTIKAFKKNVK